MPLLPGFFPRLLLSRGIPKAFPGQMGCIIPPCVLGLPPGNPSNWKCLKALQRASRGGILIRHLNHRTNHLATFSAKINVFPLTCIAIHPPGSSGREFLSFGSISRADVCPLWNITELGVTRLVALRAPKIKTRCKRAVRFYKKEPNASALSLIKKRSSS